MQTTAHPRAVTVAAIALIAAIGLSGCTAINDAASKRSTTTADSLAELSGEVPTWIPSDASSITQVRGTAGDAASILITSSEDLDPGLCTSKPRLSAPTMEVDGAPDVFDKKVTDVFSCGDWAVIPSADGWYGWTPATEGDATPATTPAP